MQVQVYLRISRADLASKTLSRMQELDDDDALTHLAHVNINLFEGGEQKATEALEILEEMCAANDTVLLRNLMAVAHMQLHQFTPAFKILHKCRDMAKQSEIETPSCTLINAMTCLQHLNKGSQTLDKLFEELKKNEPDHPFVIRKEAMEQLFDKVAQKIKV
ncbi:epsilon subunit of coatomer protein complex-like protein [Reticulomyxa filosa]|uniref:Epsilon subunit of coatomer protein complex-like protein n=1 Tax=Reticulomyxa filosa TaxID=46433 RepID=X6NVX5_RETFI|nr:epsilon subunit of coatomer protein complex-like protein [Reticulomyxa filosa]|eukprot:ETO29412.1 epsilon subunit of coatomer protein complex-like protein [Reticulomyxa filosa]